MSNVVTPRGIVATCPHCQASTLIRTSRMMNRTFREVWAFCVKCGFSGVAALSWERELSHSLLPHPEVNLRQVSTQEACNAFLAALESSGEIDQLDLFGADHPGALSPPPGLICAPTG